MFALNHETTDIYLRYILEFHKTVLVCIERKRRYWVQGDFLGQDFVSDNKQYSQDHPSSNLGGAGGSIVEQRRQLVVEVTELQAASKQVYSKLERLALASFSRPAAPAAIAAVPTSRSRRPEVRSLQPAMTDVVPVLFPVVLPVL